jgi:RNA polymerase sigma-70 factor (ECF subfamily)
MIDNPSRQGRGGCRFGFGGFMSVTSATLLERLRDRNDAEAWRVLVELYTPLLTGWLRRYALQGADVDDLVQEILAAVVREAPRFRHSGRPGAFRHWLRTILANRLREFWRARRSQPTGTGDSDFVQMLDQLEDPESGISHLWDQEHDRHIARRLLEKLEPRFAPSTWLAFRRVVLDEARPDVVAAELGLTVNAVFIAKSRVLQRLRQETRDLLD